MPIVAGYSVGGGGCNGEDSSSLRRTSYGSISEGGEGGGRSPPLSFLLRLRPGTLCIIVYPSAQNLNSTFVKVNADIRIWFESGMRRKFCVTKQSSYFM